MFLTVEEKENLKRKRAKEKREKELNKLMVEMAECLKIANENLKAKKNPSHYIMFCPGLTEKTPEENLKDALRGFIRKEMKLIMEEML